MTPLPGRLAALVAATLVAAMAVAGTPAEARGGSAPVTAPDTATTYPGNLVFAKVLANDTDADGEKLTICGLSPMRYDRVRADLDLPGKITVAVSRHAAPGSYAFTYSACDGTSQTPGTFTLVVAEAPKITVKPVPHRPGTVRATSRAPFKVKLTYGGKRRDDPDGVVLIPKKGSVVFTTPFHDMIWFADTADGKVFLAHGELPYIP